jgi:hypothetical protein
MAITNPFAQKIIVVEGNSDLALIAQVNRWVKSGGGQPFPLLTPIAPGVATVAVQILQQRYASSLLQTADPTMLKLIMDLASAAQNPSSYVSANRDQIIQTLARYGDSIGLPAAEYGITSRGFSWKWPLVVVLALASIGSAIALNKRLRRSLPA